MAKLLHQVVVKFVLQFVARSKVSMAAFGREGMVFGAIPVHAGLTESGSGSDERRISGGGTSRIEGDVVVRIKIIDAVSMGFQIINHPQILDRGLEGKLCGIYDPGQVGSVHLSVQYRTRNTKTGAGCSSTVIAQEEPHNLVKGFVAAAGIDSFAGELEFPALQVEESDSGVGAANVS